jgi:hypothetical protein
MGVPNRLHQRRLCTSSSVSGAQLAADAPPLTLLPQLAVTKLTQSPDACSTAIRSCNGRECTHENAYCHTT